jgi:NADPH2:quinone reductase
MKAVIIKQDGMRRDLAIVQLAPPVITADEVLIKVAYAGVNRADLYQVEGSYLPPEEASVILGLEISGTIVSLGNKVSGWLVGDEVCALVAGGGYAQYVAVPASMLLPIPKGLGLLQAASLPEAIYTNYLNLMVKANLRAGETLLVHGGASGIGTFAIQMAKTVGAFVIATASSAEKCLYSKNLGADRVINYHQEQVEVKADVVLDMFGGDYLDKNIKSLNYGGRLVIIALIKGNKAEINLGSILIKNLTVFGSTLRSQSLALKQQLTKDIINKVWPQIVNGHIKTIIDQVFSLDEVLLSHNYMRSNSHMGKIMLQVNHN